MNTTSLHNGVKKCPHRPDCPGCPLFETEFDEWRTSISDSIAASQRAYSNIPEVTEFHGAPQRLAYRQRCRWRVEDSKSPLGFFLGGSRDFISIRECAIHHPEIERVSDDLRVFLSKSPAARKAISVLDLRFDGHDVFITFCTLERSSEEIERIALSFQKGEHIAINFAPKHPNAIMSGTQRVVRGKEKLSWTLGKHEFEAASPSFFQVNPRVLELIHDRVISYLKDKTADAIYDYYCGIGVHGITLAAELIDKKRAIFGFDGSESAIEDARRNAARILGDKHEQTQFVHARDSSTSLPSPLPNSVAILNPSRTGISGKIVLHLGHSNFSSAIYVSCNANTLFRDLENLKALGYQTEKIEAFEMMPRSDHVELVAFLSRKDAKETRLEHAFWPESRTLRFGVSGPSHFDSSVKSQWIAIVKGEVPHGKPPGGKEILVKKIRKHKYYSIVAIESINADENDIFIALKRWKHPVKGKVGGREFGRPLLHCVRNGEQLAAIPEFFSAVGKLPTVLLEKNHFE